MAQAALKFTGSRMANPKRAPSPAQLAARAKFAEMARSGALKKKRKAAPKRKANPSTNQGLAIYLDAIAQGDTYSESKLMEALEHPAAASMADQTVIKAALRGAPYSHTRLHDIAIKIRQHGAVAKAIKASRPKIGATEAKTINRLLMGRHGNPGVLKMKIEGSETPDRPEGMIVTEAGALRFAKSNMPSDLKKAGFSASVFEGRRGWVVNYGKSVAKRRMNPAVKYTNRAKDLSLDERVGYSVHSATMPGHLGFAWFSKKADAVEAAQEASNRTGKQLAVSRMQIHFGPL